MSSYSTVIITHNYKKSFIKRFTIRPNGQLSVAVQQFKSRMDIFEDSLKANMWRLSFGGAMVPKFVNKKIYYLYSFIIQVVFITPVSVMPLVRLFFMEEPDVEKVANNMMLSSEIVLVPYKVFSLLLYQEKLQRAVTYWDRAKNIDKNSPTVTEMMKSVKHNTKVYYISCMLVFGCWAIKGIVNMMKNEAAMDMWLPFDPVANKVNLIGSYLYMGTGL